MKKFKEYCEECGCPEDICCGQRVRKEMLEKIEEMQEAIKKDDKKRIDYALGKNIGAFQALGRLRSFLQEEENQGGVKEK